MGIEDAPIGETDFFIDKDIAKGYSLIGDRRVVIAEVRGRRANFLG